MGTISADDMLMTWETDEKRQARIDAAKTIAKRLIESQAPPAVDTKPTNPKDLIGSDKLPLHLWPETATAAGCLALLEGALKYGRSNWRVAGVRASIYVDALRRHVGRWFEGEDLAPDSGLPHLAHALACLAILVDAEAAEMLVDDRNIAGGFVPALDAHTPLVAMLKEKYADRAPRHYTIADNTPPDLFNPFDAAVLASDTAQLSFKFGEIGEG